MKRKESKYTTTENYQFTKENSKVGRNEQRTIRAHKAR